MFKIPVSTCEVKAGGIQGQPQLCSDFEATLSFTRPCFKQTKQSPPKPTKLLSSQLIQETVLLKSLNICAVDMLSWNVYCGTLSSLPGLYLLDISILPLPTSDNGLKSH